MPLVAEVKYEVKIPDFNNMNSEMVLEMLRDVRRDIRRVDPIFTNANLQEVLKTVERGNYEFSGNVLTRIDLTAATRVIQFYRRFSEGGCRSCVNFGREIIDAQDASVGWYCGVSDPDYQEPVGVKYEGFTPKVTRYNNTPCEAWKPRFSPKLEEVIKDKD